MKSYSPWISGKEFDLQTLAIKKKYNQVKFDKPPVIHHSELFVHTMQCVHANLTWTQAKLCICKVTDPNWALISVPNRLMHPFKMHNGDETWSVFSTLVNIKSSLWPGLKSKAGYYNEIYSCARATDKAWLYCLAWYRLWRCLSSILNLEN